MNKTIKKISRIVGTLALIGITIFGAVGCGIAKSDYNTALEEKAALAQQVQDLQITKANMEDQALNLAKDNAAINEILESNKLILDEKDAEILALTAEIEAEIAKEDAATTEAVLESEEYDDLVLGEMVPAKDFDTYDLSFLNKDEIEFFDNDYDFREFISVDGLKIGTGFTDDVDFEDSPYLLFTQKGAVSYTYKFDDVIDYTEISEDETLEINFLGNDIEIVEMDANEFTYKIADEYELQVDEELIVGEHVIKLLGISEEGDDILVSVDDEIKAIDKDDTEKFGDIEITNTRAFLGKTVQFAKIEVGTDVLQTIEDGDEYIKDNENFVWEFETDGDNLKSLSIKYDIKADDIDEAVLAVGDSLDFAGYFDLTFDLETTYDYVTYNVGFDEVTDADVAVMAFETDNDDIRVGSEKVSVAYFDGTNSYYKDGNDWVVSTDVIKLENDDTTLDVGFNANKVSFGDFQLRTLDFKALGAEELAEDNDVKFDGDNIGTVDESLMFPGGFIAESIEDNAENDEFVFQVPNEEVKAVLRLTQK